ncbi:MAG: hypothetical protein N4J56_007725 [Chroococcidiopsis sp. SAG 2025]|nr:hypothetical protein [Chroococcidiopsis sp. SAG 2025]
MLPDSSPETGAERIHIAGQEPMTYQKTFDGPYQFLAPNG